MKLLAKHGYNITLQSAENKNIDSLIFVISGADRFF